jgi:hypothetical protein
VTIACYKFDAEIKINRRIKMTALLNIGYKFAAVFFSAFLFFAFCGNTSAQEKNFYNAPAKKQADMIKNLELGLKSTNDGLRRSSIYFAGYYQINELTAPLADMLKNESDSKDRVFLLLALYKIGGEESYKAIHEYVLNGNDLDARRLAKSILNEFTAAHAAALSVSNK